MNGNNPIHTELSNCKTNLADRNEQIRSCACTEEDCPADTTFIDNGNLTIPITKIHCVDQSDSHFVEQPFCICQDQKLLSHRGECVDPLECTCRENGQIITSGLIKGKTLRF